MMRFRLLIPGMLALLLSCCLMDGPFKLPYKGFTPRNTGDGTSISTPEAELMDREMLDRAFRLVYDEDRFYMARSLLVYRNGKLVAEAYPNDTDDINQIHHIQSATKSVTSLMVGAAIQQGHAIGMNEKLYDILPESFDGVTAKRYITIGDTLTMRTGLAFDNSSDTSELYTTQEDSAAFVLSKSMKYPHGIMMNYNDGSPQLISRVIEKKCGMSLEKFARTALFDPLEIREWKWEHAKDGTSFGAFGLYVKPRDFGKIGILLAGNGAWEGTQIIDPAYLADAVTAHTSGSYNNAGYGYYFWTLDAYGGYYASGHGGQFLLVVPGKNLSVVYTAWPYTSAAMFDQSNDLMTLIIESCR